MQYIQSNELDDNTDYLQFGNSDHKSFHYNKKEINILGSTWSTFPTKENPDTRFKFLSFYLIRDPDLNKISRKTNGLVDILADVGGLMRALFFIGNLLISPFSKHALYSLLSTLLIRVVPSTQ